MTIAAGFACHDGVLLCSDSQFTGADKEFRDKIVTHFDGQANVAFAFSGDEDYARGAIEDCVEEIEELPLNGRTTKSLKECIRKTVSIMSAEYRSHYPNSGDKPEFLVAITTPEEQVQLFKARDSAMPSVDRVAFLGSGAYLGEYIVEAFFGKMFVTIEDALLPAMYALTAAVSHDQYCGGRYQLCGMRGQLVHRVWLGRHGDSPASVIRDFQHECGVVLGFMSGGHDEYFRRTLELFPQKMETLRNELMSHDGYKALFEFMRETSSETSQI
jgi:hypothetical protein